MRAGLDYFPRGFSQNVKLAYQKTGKREPPVANQGNKQVQVKTEREARREIIESGPYLLPQNVILPEPYTYFPAHSVVLGFFPSLVLIVSKFNKVKVSS